MKKGFYWVKRHISGWEIGYYDSDREGFIFTIGNWCIPKDGSSIEEIGSYLPYPDEQK